MKRIISSALAIIMLYFCVIPCQAASIDEVSEADLIYVDYENFHGNREYYDALLLQGYGICVYVGDQYADAEIARITQSAETVHTLKPSIQARGTSLPTADYNVHTNPHYSFTCDADYETLYTNYKFYGCTSYMIDGFNEDYNNNLRVRVYNTINGTIDFSVPPRSTIYKIITTESESDRFYPAFYAPSNAYGEIYCIGH